MMGRPTKYKPKHCDMLIEFFDIEPWEERKIEHFKNGQLAWTDIKILPIRMPTLRGFAKSIDTAISAVYRWLDEKEPCYHKEFRDAFTCAREIRKDWLIDVGLSGSAPPASFKFVAVNVTDMRDRQETEHKLSKETASLLGLIDGSSKGKLPDKGEIDDRSLNTPL